MTDINKVYTQEIIEDTAFPQEDTASLEVSQSPSGGVYNSATIKSQPIKTKRVATELLSSSLNTKSKKILAEYQFTKHGAIQVGEYQNGVSGDLRLSPDGITARDSTGLTTFAIDGTTGNAVFAGTIQAGTLISGSVIVGDSNIIIDGESKTIIVNDGTNDRVLIGYQEGGF